jgi:flagellar biosynthetic protein FliQ
MSADAAVEIIRNAIHLTLLVAAPMLLVSLLAGVLISLVQALTQIQEQTLTFIPKILAVAITLIICLPWILSRLVEFLVGSINSLSGLGS